MDGGDPGTQRAGNRLGDVSSGATAGGGFVADIIHVLREIAEIEHWTRIPATQVGGDKATRAPIILWRYKQPSYEIALSLADAIATFEGQVAWTFSWEHRNWSLMPSRIKQLKEVLGLPNLVTAAAMLEETDPELGNHATAELCLLAVHIQAQLRAVQ